MATRRNVVINQSADSYFTIAARIPRRVTGLFIRAAADQRCRDSRPGSADLIR
jgi:hypothetical protein